MGGGGRGGRGKGKGGKRGGRGGHGGRGRGGRGSGAAQQPQQVQQQPVQLRLFQLKQHLVLKCFNYLDEASRKSVFAVMGWPMDNYFRRKEAMIKQQENMKKMKQQREVEEAKKKEQEGEEKKEGEGEAAAGEEGESEGAEVGKMSMGKMAAAINEAWDDAKEETAEPKEQEETAGEDATGGEATVETESTEGEGKTEEAPKEPEKEVLPPLFARIDPETLLDRLNTRRLYGRILYYKREERKKMREETARMIGHMAGKEDYSQGITEMFERELKDKMTHNRVWPKNMSIQEMADKEWEELLEIAELRNKNKEVPFEPIPTQHELLLFSPCPHAVRILASYPRSGNSLMRTLYEHTTLRVTGSDMQGGLAKHDLVGEMAIGANMVQFVKTHFPERQGGAPFRACRVVLLVRNPIDALESFFNLMMTGTHTTSISPEVREKTKKIWEEYVLREIRVWKGFHTFWMNQDVPILLIRYEDLTREPAKVMGRVLQFVLEVKRMGTFFTERIDRCISDQQDIERMGSYKPRSGGIGKALSKYSPELLQKLKDDAELQTILKHFGYEDLLDKPVETWKDMDPLEHYATEYLPSWHNTENKKVVILNRGNQCRGRNEVTPWQKIKVDLGIKEGNCDCEKCRAMRAGGDSANAQEGKEATADVQQAVEGNEATEGDGEQSAKSEE